MTGAEITIVHLYPAEMNIYGDRGNVLTLAKRLAWRGLPHRVERVGIGDPFDWRRADLVFSGGGQDAGQAAVAADLAARRDDLAGVAGDGVPILTICGTYQLFGHRFVTSDGEDLEGIGLLDLETRAGEGRLIGNVVVDTDFGRLVGFENHGGRTRLAPGQAPLGRVVSGHGNDGESGEEGAVTGHTYGTYLHGPVLPKNPAFADRLLSAAAARHGYELEPLDDDVERAAAAVAATRPT